MQIGITTSVGQRGKTGIAQYLFALIRALLEQNTHQYTLFVLENDIELFRFAASRARIVTVSEEFRPAVKDIAWHQTILPGLARKLQLDVLHVPSYRRMIWQRPCPLVATIHDLAQFHVRKKYSWTRMVYGKLVVPRLARRQDQIVAISENTARDVARFFGVPENRLSVVYNGVEHSRFFPGAIQHAKDVASRRFGLELPYFLYIARLEHPGKNHVRLISAFNKFKAATGSNWQLALAGGDWHGAEHIHQAAKESPYSSDIRRLGFVMDDYVADLYRAAGSFVYPSLFEGFGMPPTEAMACGCPVICSTRGSLAEVVGKAAAMVDPEDVDAMAAQLGALSADSVLRKRMSTAGLEQARRFNWSGTARAMAKIYERAAA